MLIVVEMPSVVPLARLILSHFLVRQSETSKIKRL